MSDGFRHLRMERDARGVATVTLDVQDSPVNVFNDAVVLELAEAVTRLEADKPAVVVFRSAKPSGFFAGAEIHRIRRIETEAEARNVQSVGQELFNRIERLPCPTIAAIHGVCLGGGLEFALACKHRIARADSQTKIGLPETQLGLIPGWGGTVRLPRLVGLRQALGMILEGKTLSAEKAAKVGLVDRAIPPEKFEAEVNAFIGECNAGRSVRQPSRGLMGTLLDGTWAGRAIVFSTAGKRAAKKGRDYPAIAAALRVIQIGSRNGPEAGLAAERDEFPRLLFGPVARNLIDLFLNRELARKPATWVAAEHAPRRIRKAAVLGAGVMGAGIAQLLALNKISVVLKDINAEIVAAGKKRIDDLTADAAKKGAISPEEAAAASANITATHEWEPLAGAELAIEAVVEREDIKRSVFKELASRLGPDAVLASNTSALSITRIGEATEHPGRVAGLHFFNPVHRMPLVEVVRGRATDDRTIATLVELVRKLGKVPVVVADSPGFLVNRILFPYLDEAVRLVLEGIPGEVVDKEAFRFGMPMGPLELLDQVGVDVAADVSKTFAALTTDVGPSPARFAEMVKDGSLGKKVSKGFYTYPDGKRGEPTHWAKVEGKTADIHHEAKGDGELSTIQRRLIYPMINEAAKCLEAGIVPEAWMIDLAMVLGTGFAPFRGGPLHVADAIGLARIVREMDEFRASAGPRFEPAPLLRAFAADKHLFHTEATHTHEEVRR
jgi:3-hydroxyacyl-CoA dehydrogenase / enoyl-CoA hydratase / 3-hydroxybutyryl-CoA epimerase